MSDSGKESCRPLGLRDAVILVDRCRPILIQLARLMGSVHVPGSVMQTEQLWANLGGCWQISIRFLRNILHRSLQNAVPTLPLRVAS